jgi:hypothetical protein
MLQKNWSRGSVVLTATRLLDGREKNRGLGSRQVQEMFLRKGSELFWDPYSLVIRWYQGFFSQEEKGVLKQRGP